MNIVNVYFRIISVIYFFFVFNNENWIHILESKHSSFVDVGIYRYCFYENCSNYNNYSGKYLSTIRIQI